MENGITPYSLQSEVVQLIFGQLLSAMDGFVRRRLGSILRKYHKNGTGTGSNINDHQHWTNAYFASVGLFTMIEAHAEASRPR